VFLLPLSHGCRWGVRLSVQGPSPGARRTWRLAGSVLRHPRSRPSPCRATARRRCAATVGVRELSAGVGREVGAAAELSAPLLRHAEDRRHVDEAKVACGHGVEHLTRLSHEWPASLPRQRPPDRFAPTAHRRGHSRQDDPDRRSPKHRNRTRSADPRTATTPARGRHR
jgi:hypothetical protein